jgi:hypothetical protein
MTSPLVRTTQLSREAKLADGQTLHTRHSRDRSGGGGHFVTRPTSNRRLQLSGHIELEPDRLKRCDQRTNVWGGSTGAPCIVQDDAAGLVIDPCRRSSSPTSPRRASTYTSDISKVGLMDGRPPWEPR